MPLLIFRSSLLAILKYIILLTIVTMLCIRSSELTHILVLFKVKVKMKSLSHDQLFVTPQTVVYQAPKSMGFYRQERWNRWPFPSPGDLPNPGMEPRFLALQADASPSQPPGRSFNTCPITPTFFILMPCMKMLE